MVTIPFSTASAHSSPLHRFAIVHLLDFTTSIFRHNRLTFTPQKGERRRGVGRGEIDTHHTQSRGSSTVSEQPRKEKKTFCGFSVLHVRIESGVAGEDIEGLSGMKNDGYERVVIKEELDTMSGVTDDVAASEEYATPYEKSVFEAINCLISPNRNDDVAFELHSKRSVPNGKLMRRAGASSSSTSNSTSVKRGSEKRTSTMYVLREGRKNTNVKEKSTYVKRADRQSSEKCLSSSTVMTVERKKRKRSKKLSEQLQQKGVDIIQTEVGKCSNPSKPGVLGLIEKVI
ncbi:hypothetical protein L2E82_30668 [Cichorium intybus]|uniref:Uncharacterized protein n=1 Tax=Cichorium intybus TaxID=13427 RepID=A0ACB9D0V1_CICIN|nr:hypothetical protein L2E82_30668 [Cichorium intybus]